MLQRLLVLVVVLACACGAEPAQKKPFGALPSATTTAEPEWLPFAMRAGVSVEADPRERHLASLRRLTEGWDVVAAAFSPDLRSAALAARSPGDAEPRLWTLALDSGKKARISTEGERVVGVTSTSTDPWRLVYVVETAGGRSLRETVAGAAPTRVEIGPLAPRSAALSPDGRALFVVGDAGKERGLFATDRAGAPRLVLGGRSAAPPAVSPDRGYVAWAADAESQRTVTVASVEGRSPRPVVSSASSSFTGLTFLPATRKLLFASDLDAAAGELYAVDLDEAAARPIRVTFAQGDAPSASYDGRSLLFASTRGGSTRDLYVARWVDDP